MPRVEIYSKGYCPYCKAAKQLIDQLNWSYKEVEITGSAELREEMIQRTSRNTVPQIFINEEHIGGFDDFSRYVQQKQLI